MTSNENAMREAFEKIDFRGGHGGSGSDDFGKQHAGADFGMYSSDKTQWRYEGYKAALSTLPTMTEAELAKVLYCATGNYIIQNIEKLFEAVNDEWLDQPVSTGVREITYRDVARALLARLPHILKESSNA